jgi:3',5'-cyclic-nucleotide phosphodiesterase
LVVYKYGLKDKSRLNDLEIFSTLVSGAAHDVDHPGTNNVFEIKCRSKLALLYND